MISNYEDWEFFLTALSNFPRPIVADNTIKYYEYPFRSNSFLRVTWNSLLLAPRHLSFHRRSYFSRRWTSVQRLLRATRRPFTNTGCIYTRGAVSHSDAQCEFKVSPSLRLLLRLDHKDRHAFCLFLSLSLCLLSRPSCRADKFKRLTFCAGQNIWPKIAIFPQFSVHLAKQIINLLPLSNF